ncbi:MAG: alpha/beta hydrolase, partial [Alphaproteobacteria bacterium]
LDLAEGKSLSDGVVLITHGTLAHNKMEIIVALQDSLKERGVSSLAISLSFAQNDRRGMFDCTTDIRHKHTDAMDEIAAWIGWLKNKGVGDIVLSGHSRGGNQTAWFMAEGGDDAVKGAVLIAPATWSATSTRKSYKARYKTDLDPLLGKMGTLVNDGKGGDIVKDIGTIYCANASVTPESFLSYYADNENRDTPTVLKRVKKPVLVIAGSEDNVVKDLPGAMAGTVSSNIRVDIVDGADHFFRDLYAEDLADMIAEFREGLK